MRVVVLEVGRPIRGDVEAQLGEATEVISYPRAITEEEYPTILKQAYQAIVKASRGGEEVVLVLSGPLGLAFSLGQAVGMGHFKILVYQFSAGRYRPVPPVTREMLF